MAVIKLNTPQSGEVLLTAQTVKKLLDCKSGNAALLYIYILSNSCELEVEVAAKRLGLSPSDVSRALVTLEECRLISRSDAKKLFERPDTVPEYSPTDVAEHMGSDKSFKYLAEFCESSLGKLLSTVDLQVLLGIYSWLGLPVDVICLLVTSCIEEMRKKYGPGRVPTMRTIEKRAKIWLRNGVLSLDRAEEYLKEQEKLGEDKSRIAKILRISGRALAPTEDKYISEWIRLDLPDELIASAYDITVTNTGSLKWGYMHKILSSWHSLGFKSLADVEAGRKPEPSADSSSGDTDAAMKLRELNRKIRQKREE